MANTMHSILTSSVSHAEVKVYHHPTFSAVATTLWSDDDSHASVTVHCPTASDLHTVMAAMAKCVRAYYADAEPEPDWEAIAAEYDELCRER